MGAAVRKWTSADALGGSACAVGSALGGGKRLGRGAGGWRWGQRWAVAG